MSLLRWQDGGDGRRKVREDSDIGGNAGQFPKVKVNSARQSYTGESISNHEDMVTVDDICSIGEVAYVAAVQPTNVPTRSVLEDALRAVKQEEGENTDAILARALARAILNEQPRNEVPLYHVIPDLSKNIENFSGDGKGVRPKDWINSIESMRRIHQWPENFALKTARAFTRWCTRLVPHTRIKPCELANI